MENQSSAYAFERTFGKDTPIGALVEERYKEALKDCNTTNDYVNAICDYANELHNEQAQYVYYYPVGGLDIDIIPIEDIAKEEARKIHHHCIKDISLEGFEDDIYIELLKRGVHTPWLNDIITCYEDYPRYAEQADGMYQKFQELKSKKRYNEEVAKVYIELDQKIEELNKQKKQLQAQKIKNLIFHRSFKKQYKKIALKIEEHKKNAASKVSLLQRNYDYKMKWPPTIIIIQHYHACVVAKLCDEEAVESFKKEAAKFVEENTDLYNRCCRLLKAAGIERKQNDITETEG